MSTRARRTARRREGTDFDVVHEPKLPKPAPAATAAVTPPTTQPQPSPAPTEPAVNPQAPGQAQPQPTPGGERRRRPTSRRRPTGRGPSTPRAPVGPGTTPSLLPAPRTDAAGGKMCAAGARAHATPGTMTPTSPRGRSDHRGPGQSPQLREADASAEERAPGLVGGVELRRWRSAIENYVSSVKPGNQTALNRPGSLRVVLNGMHNRIHPIFAGLVPRLADGLPPNHR